MQIVARDISRRIIEIRQRCCGERGKSLFSRTLGVPVTTYQHYETGRIPPVETLVRIADAGGVSLGWLLFGESSSAIERPTQRSRLLADRLLQILGQNPELNGPVEEFLKLLERSTHDAAGHTAENSSATRANASPTTEPFTTNSRHLIPVVGSTAAGLAHYWSELEVTHGGPEADARLEQLLSDHVQRSSEECWAQVSSGQQAVSLVQLSRPDEFGFLEFLDAAHIKAAYPDAVAWRIDGDSMSPRYQDGDLVITSPSHPAVSMHPCVARQRGQIGVNCKLYQEQGDTVLLVPINPTSVVQKISRAELLWAWRILGVVQLHR